MVKFEELKVELEVKYGVCICLLLFDVCDWNVVIMVLVFLLEEWKCIDVLVNNVGFVIGVDKEFEGNLDEWDIVIDINIKVLLVMMCIVVFGMVECGYGYIINIGLIVGDVVYFGGSVYCVIKVVVKVFLDGLCIDLVDILFCVINIKLGMVEINFMVVCYCGDKDVVDVFYKGICLLIGDDIVEIVYYVVFVFEYI